MQLKLFSRDDIFLSKRLNIINNKITHKYKKHKNITINSDFQVNEIDERLELIVIKQNTKNLTTLELLLIGKLLAFPLHNKTIMEESYTDKHHYRIEFNNNIPIKPIILAIGELLDINIIQNNDLVIFESGYHQFNKFLQQVYILIFLHVRNNDEYILTEKFIKNLRKYCKTWISVLPLKARMYILKQIKNPKNNFVGWLREQNKVAKTVAYEEIIVSLVNELNISSVLEIGLANNGIISYIVAHHNKNINVTGISADNDRVIVSRQSKSSYNGKSLDGAYYKNLTFVHCNPSYPVLIDYSPVDLLVISDYDIEELYLMIVDFYRPKYLIYISKTKVDKFKLNIINISETVHRDVYIYLIELKRSNKPSIWQQFYEAFTNNNKYKNRALNDGFVYNLAEYTGDLQKLYEISLEHYRTKKINSYK